MQDDSKVSQLDDDALEWGETVEVPDTEQLAERIKPCLQVCAPACRRDKARGSPYEARGSGLDQASSLRRHLLPEGAWGAAQVRGRARRARTNQLSAGFSTTMK